MTLTLAELLDMPVLKRALPEVVYGEHSLDRPVRWVHTSEIAGIGPLLKGGEVLLTTGLGLAGASDRGIGQYVDELADCGVTALALELGRTFTVPPPALLNAVRERDLPLVVLHAVVPFVEVTQAVHEVLLGRQLDVLRRAEEVTAALNDALLAGLGLSEIINRVARLAGTHAALVAADGHVVASSDSRRRLLPFSSTSADGFSAPVEVFETEWGRLHLDGQQTAERTVVLERGVVAVTLELLRSGHVTPDRTVVRRALLADLADGRFSSADELVARTNMVGFTPREGRFLVAVALKIDPNTPRRAALAAVEEAAHRVLGLSLAADLDGEILVAGPVAEAHDQSVRLKLKALVEDVNGELKRTTGGRVVAAAAGPIVRDVPGLVRSLPLAREARRLASNLGPGARILLSSDVGVHRLLARLVGDAELERFIDEQLGPLLSYDAVHGRDLVGTLDEYLNSGRSKTLAARRLGIRRQSLYARLARIEGLVGAPLSDPRRSMALSLALIAWRIRSAGPGISGHGM